MKKLTALLLAVLLTACASTGTGEGYKFGDVSKKYCASTTPEGRAFLKAQLVALGLTIGPDYCATVGLVDALAHIAKGE